MFDILHFDTTTVFAMLVLYAVLGIGSIVVSLWRPSSQMEILRLRFSAWWYIFPVLSLASALYLLGPCLLFVFIAVLVSRELALQHPTSSIRLNGLVRF